MPDETTVPPPPSNFPIASSKSPEVLSNNAVSKIKALPISTTSVLEPVKLGCCVDVATRFNALISSIKVTLLVAFAEANPILSTDLTKYVPVNAGTVTVFAGLDTFIY